MEVAVISVRGSSTATNAITWDAGTYNTPLGARTHALAPLIINI